MKERKLPSVDAINYDIYQRCDRSCIFILDDIGYLIRDIDSVKDSHSEERSIIHERLHRIYQDVIKIRGNIIDVKNIDYDRFGNKII